ncbi:MAG TPA: DUF1553 domain-containing protein [Verrucomicrobiota bacterium]|nr:hypothetical protein [Verrucomicrobiales bacterium]HRI14831.1 DUF1553 domain-containing protein [Verrucomicrobiota bacterium]
MQRRCRSAVLLGIALLAIVVAAESTPAADSVAANSNFRQPASLDWWSLKPLVRPPEPLLPAGSPGTLAQNPVDRFVLATLRSKQLEPSPEADRRTLIRRLYFDLIGLPPNPADVEAFAANSAPDAYERLVDRLLASPQYGERWARHWLDVVHYGETHGYDKDQPRPNAWPYRDYVIRAFNEDKPYSRFVQEQVAGDVLWPDTEDGLTAVGFIAAGPWDLIGHAEVPETKTDGKIARLLDRDDMVGNVMNTFTSTTVQCARCHDHKFDPVSMVDYYRLTAVFAALDRADRRFDTDPAIARERADLERQQRELKAAKKELDQKLLDSGGRSLALLDRLIAETKAGDAVTPQAEFGWHSELSAVSNVIKWVQIDLGVARPLDRIVYVGCRDDFNGIGDGFGFPRRYRIEASNHPEFGSDVEILSGHTEAAVPNPGVTPQELKFPGKQARYLRFTATELAPRQNDFNFALAEVLVFDTNGVNHALGAPVTSSDSIEAPPRWSRANLTDGYYPGHTRGPAAVPLGVLETQRAVAMEKVTDDGTQTKLTRVAAQLDSVESALKKLPPARVVYAGTIHQGSGAFRGTGPDGGKPRPIFVLARGDVKKPGREVGPGTVEFISGVNEFPLPADAPEGERRVALANWLTDPRNPLTWRSIVNRVWQYHFGRGLVDSPNDFGRMGRNPTHPELLDWLAVEFRDGGQSLKSLHRLLVTSRTYRQSVASSLANERVDADNQFLWRMNRRKLEAEAVRDTMLSVAGKLDPAMGGPSFQDFVVERPEHSPHYEYHLHDPEDPKSQRRSIYRFLVRSQPQPFMATLDCADPSMSVDRRNETMNALQALALLNNDLAVAMARHLANRVTRDSPVLEDQVRAAVALALSRSPKREEVAMLAEYARQNGLPNACRVIFNLNEFLFVD